MKSGRLSLEFSGPHHWFPVETDRFPVATDSVVTLSLKVERSLSDLYSLSYSVVRPGRNSYTILLVRSTEFP